MNDGYIAQEDREGRRERESEGCICSICSGVVSEIYFSSETGEVRGNSDIIKLCT